jgi:hypothetical protein
LFINYSSRFLHELKGGGARQWVEERRTEEEERVEGCGETGGFSGRVKKRLFIICVLVHVVSSSSFQCFISIRTLSGVYAWVLSGTVY